MLDPDAIAELIPDLKTRAELNEFEQANIARAVTWAHKSRLLKGNLLSVASLQRLHQRMFDSTWRWAGRFRTSDTNIGVTWSRIPEQMRMLCDNTNYQISNHVYSWDELGVRFHHRLVSIHPFTNGNGRHARLVTDLLLSFNGQPEFTWGSIVLSAQGEVRRNYLSALREADGGSFKSLLVFVKS